jgi:DNA-binding NtrC family response regulator
MPSPPSAVLALVINAQSEERRALREIFAHAHWKWNSVPSIQKALKWLARRGSPQVMLCDRDLPDGTWLKLFDRTESLPRAPKFIVSSRLADEYLWAEVLNLGGHDVLATPFDEREVSRVVGGALRSWQGQWQAGFPPMQMAAASHSASK